MRWLVRALGVLLLLVTVSALIIPVRVAGILPAVAMYASFEAASIYRIGERWDVAWK